MSGLEPVRGDADAPRPHEVAAFDFDGTVTFRDTFVPFLAYLRGRRAVAQVLARRCGQVAAVAAGRASRDALKADIVRDLLAGVPVDTYRDAAHRFSTAVLPAKVRPEVRDRVAWHRAQGHEPVIVSASLVDYLEPVGHDLGFAAVLATEVEAGADGRLTGHLAGANCRGPEKLRRVEAHLAAGGVLVWAYGNSDGDREMLAAARYPVRVRNRRWPVLASATTSG